MQQSSLTKALKEFFGFKPDQTLTGFMAELKELTDADRAYFKAEFLKVGIEIV